MKRRVPTIESFAKDELRVSESFTMGLKSHEALYDDIMKVLEKHTKRVNKDDMLECLKTVISEISA